MKHFIIFVVYISKISKMNFEQGKQEFLGTWGTLATQWGINRTMAQIHALLLISPEALSAEEIMEELSISRGNANMNIRELITWDLVKKILKPGERKEFFEAEKDMFEIFKRVARERKRREIEPVLKVLEQLSSIEEDSTSVDVVQFRKTVKNMTEFVSNANKTIDTIIKADENWFFSSIFKLMK